MCLLITSSWLSPVAVARPRQSSSSPAMAPGPVSSLIMASWRPLIGPEPQYWPLIGQPLLTITQSADMSLTAGGEMHFLLWQEYWLTKFTLCNPSPDTSNVFPWNFPQKIYHFCGLPCLVFSSFTPIRVLEFTSLLTELCRFIFLIYGTDRQFSLKGKGMKIVYKLKSFELFDCFECSKHYN